MWNVLRAVHAFLNYHGTSDTSVPAWDKSLKRNHFRHYLIVETHLCESYRDKFERWYFGLRKIDIPNSEDRQVRARKQIREVDFVIDKAMELEVIKPVNANLPPSFDMRLKTDYKSHEFIKLLHFVEALAREYGYIASILTSFLLGGITISWVFSNLLRH